MEAPTGASKRSIRLTNGELMASLTIGPTSVRSPSKRKRNNSVSISASPAEIFGDPDTDPSPAPQSEVTQTVGSIADTVQEPTQQRSLTKEKVGQHVTPPSTPMKHRSSQSQFEAGSASPRTAVARQLEQLQLQNLPPTPTKQPLQKKIRKNISVPSSASEVENVVDAEPTRGQVADVGGPVQPSAGGPESNGLHARSFAHRQKEHTTTRSEIPDTSGRGDNASSTYNTTETAATTKQQPPPPQTSIFTFTSLPNSKISPQTTEPSRRTPSPERNTLTWTFAEITGHRPTDPDDDMTGINGVGFKPTPAIARARAMKRREQVERWRKREQEEARRKRAEVRAEQVISSASAALELQSRRRRSVRFA